MLELKRLKVGVFRVVKVRLDMGQCWRSSQLAIPLIFLYLNPNRVHFPQDFALGV